MADSVDPNYKATEASKARQMAAVQKYQANLERVERTKAELLELASELRQGFLTQMTAFGSIAAAEAWDDSQRRQVKADAALRRAQADAQNDADVVKRRQDADRRKYTRFCVDARARRVGAHFPSMEEKAREEEKYREDKQARKARWNRLVNQVYPWYKMNVMSNPNFIEEMESEKKDIEARLMDAQTAWRIAYWGQAERSPDAGIHRPPELVNHPDYEKNCENARLNLQAVASELTLIKKRLEDLADAKRYDESLAATREARRAAGVLDDMDEMD